MTVDEIMEEAEPLVLRLTQKYAGQSWGVIHDIDDMRQFVRLYLIQLLRRKQAPSEDTRLAHINRNIRWAVIEFFRKNGSRYVTGTERSMPLSLSSLGKEFDTEDHVSGDATGDVDFCEILERAKEQPKYIYQNVLRACGLKNKEACAISGMTLSSGYTVALGDPRGKAMRWVEEITQ